MNPVSSVLFQDKEDVSQNKAYSYYDNDPTFVTPNNINQLKGIINYNSDCLSGLNEEVVKGVRITEGQSPSPTPTPGTTYVNSITVSNRY